MKKTKTSSRGFLAGKMLRLLKRSREYEKPNALGETVTGAYPQISSKGLMDTHFTTEAYILSEKRKNEVEIEKALAILLSRHERWKGTGGPC